MQELLVGCKSKGRGHINIEERVDEGEDIHLSDHSRPASPDALDPMPASPGASHIMLATLPVSPVALHLFGDGPHRCSLMPSESSWSVSWGHVSSWGRLCGSVVHSASPFTSSGSFANTGDDDKMMSSYVMMATKKLD